MPDKMYDCEVKTPFMENGAKVQKWVTRPVKEASDAKPIRCAHCKGRVRIHRQQVEHGPADHVEHLSRGDSEHCLGGHYFKGVHRESEAPVL